LALKALDKRVRSKPDREQLDAEIKKTWPDHPQIKVLNGSGNMPPAVRKWFEKAMREAINSPRPRAN
jgi:hypothetical protein